MVGCDPGKIIRYRNESEELLFAQVNKASLDRLPPGTTRNLDYPSDVFGDEEDALSIIIADERGCVVLRVETTLRQFEEERDSRIEIRASDLPPIEDRTECDPRLAD